MPASKNVEKAYQLAKERYAEFGIDTDEAIQKALDLPISLHCWQGDDVNGFEVKPDAADGGGIMATGNYPGRARDGNELRADLEKAMSLLPGQHKVNVHACYAETGGKPVDRDVLEPEHFADWMAWAKDQKIGLDFNTTNFAHPKADDGMTLSHPDASIREFWIRHGIACRRIAEKMADETGKTCVLNHWLPDGMKDLPADRLGPRQRLIESLDAILDTKHQVDTSKCLDAVESKLFGIGSEAYVVGSFEFYMGYAVSRGIRLCLDMGHFHPTETIHDKISSALLYLDNLLIHVSRPIRWDSDHVVLFNDDVKAVFQEVVRCRAMGRVALALDFFDASINRIAAYVTGTRASRKALLYALLEPNDMLKKYENESRFAQRLALMEDMKTMPFGAVWDALCEQSNVPVGYDWMGDVEAYENDVLLKRG